MCNPYLLHDAASIHLQRQMEDVAFHLVGQDLLLGLVSMLKELLYHIVPKDVAHQLKRVRQYFAEDLVLLVAVGRLQLLLDEP